MDQHDWEANLRLGVGGPPLWRLRRATAVATSIDFTAVGMAMSRDAVDVCEADAADAVGFLLLMAGELLSASARLLSVGEHYAGCALLRQITEIEYLTWTIKEKHRSALDWLRSTHEERKKMFSPAVLRRTSKGRFLDKDYRDHCEQGGHPTARGVFLLGGRDEAAGQLFLVDLLTHSWRTWDQVAAWAPASQRALVAVTQKGRRVSWRLHDWGTQDPVYRLMVERHPDTAQGSRSDSK
jgi:hypothetical protein